MAMPQPSKGFPPVAVSLSAAEQAILQRLQDRLTAFEARLLNLVERRMADLKQAIDAALLETEVDIADDEEFATDEEDNEDGPH